MKVAENAAGWPEDFLAPEPATVDAVLDMLVLVREGAEDGPRPRENGLACSVAVCTAVLTDVRDRLTGGGSVADPEFVAVLGVELVKRYLRAVRNDALGGTVARSWRVLFEQCGDTSITPPRFAIAGINAHVNFDLAFALVSACTVLGRPLGAVERQDHRVLTGIVAAHLPGQGGSAVPDELVEDVDDLATLITGDSAWRRAEQSDCPQPAGDADSAHPAHRHRCRHAPAP